MTLSWNAIDKRSGRPASSPQQAVFTLIWIKAQRSVDRCRLRRVCEKNFESNLPRIEARIIKVMLAALPTDRVRKFLDAVSKGDVLGAAWNAIGAVAEGAGGLHFAFGRYRSGVETVAGSLTVACHGGGSFDAVTQTVRAAATYLGLWDEDLLYNPDELRGNRIATNIKPRAFFMPIRSIAANCVDLPYSGSAGDLTASKVARAKACNRIGFRPTPRPYRTGGDQIVPDIDHATEPWTMTNAVN